jgi:hypothetical protein
LRCRAGRMRMLRGKKMRMEIWIWWDEERLLKLS